MKCSAAVLDNSLLRRGQVTRNAEQPYLRLGRDQVAPHTLLQQRAHDALRSIGLSYISELLLAWETAL